MKTCFQIAEMQPFLCKDKQAYIGKMSTSYEVDTPVRHSVGVLPVFSLKIL